jgi:hypothetical protein
MTIIPKTNEESNALQKRFSRFVERYCVNHILRGVNATKEKGVAVYDIFIALLGLVFTHKNLYTLLATGDGALSFAKDTVYRFLGCARINWEQFVFRLSAAVIPEINALTSESRRTALILDDTPYYRNRSKKVELLSRCYYSARYILTQDCAGFLCECKEATTTCAQRHTRRRRRGNRTKKQARCVKTYRAE